MGADRSPRRGEVWLVSFDPCLGGEIRKGRPAVVSPAVVISNDAAEGLLSRVQVVPVSSQMARLYAAEAAVTLNGARHKAMADQITTTSKQRLLRQIGTLGMDDMNAIRRVVRLQLGL